MQIWSKTSVVELKIEMWASRENRGSIEGASRDSSGFIESIARTRSLQDTRGIKTERRNEFFVSEERGQHQLYVVACRLPDTRSNRKAIITRSQSIKISQLSNSKNQSTSCKWATTYQVVGSSAERSLQDRYVETFRMTKVLWGITRLSPGDFFLLLSWPYPGTSGRWMSGSVRVEQQSPATRNRDLVGNIV